MLAQIGAACDELDRLAEENPEVVGCATRDAEEHKDAYLRLKARLALADEAPRCRWVKQDGTACGSPQMKKHIYCFAHKQMMEAQALALRLPALEDANAIQIGIMRIQKALIDDVISTKKAGLMLYSMQLALQNVGQVTFGQVKAEELVRETVSVEQAVREDVFTAEGAEEGKTLPRMNTDGSGSKEEGGGARPGADGGSLLPKPIEYRLPMDLYRMDTREGMEAYEAEFRRRRQPWLDREFELSQTEVIGTLPEGVTPI